MSSHLQVVQIDMMGICDFCNRFKSSSMGSNVSKGAPDFCTVHVISKGKVSSVKHATRLAPFSSPLLDHIQKLSKPIVKGTITPRHKFNLRGLFFMLELNSKHFVYGI